MYCKFVEVSLRCLGDAAGRRRYAIQLKIVIRSAVQRELWNMPLLGPTVAMTEALSGVVGLNDLGSSTGLQESKV